MRKYNIILFFFLSLSCFAQSKDQIIQKSDLGKNRFWKVQIQGNFADKFLSADTLAGYVVSTATSKLDNGYTLSNLRGLQDNIVSATKLFYINEVSKEGFFKYDATDTSTPDNSGTILVTNTGKRLKRVYSGEIDVRWFDAKGDGVTDDKNSLQKAFDAAKNENSVIFFPNGGNYRISGTLLYNGSRLNIKGNGSTITHTTNQNYTIEVYGNTLVIAINGDTVRHTTTNPIVANTNIITLSTVEGLAKGDVLEIKAHSTDSLWCKERSYFYKGEYVEIDSIAGLNIYLKSATIDSYISGATLKKIIDSGVTIEGLTIKRNNNLGCLSVHDISNVIISNCNIQGANERGIYVYNSYNVIINNCVVNGNYFTGSGTSYGLAIGSCQNVNVIGGAYRAGRHGITLGGEIPCRYISFNGCIVDNDPAQATPLAAFDFHSNVQFATLTNVLSRNGYSLGGINISVYNCIAQSRNYYSFAFFASRDSDNSLTINGLNITHSSTYPPFIITTVGNGNTYRVNMGNVNVSNVNLVTTALTSSPALMMFAGSASNKIGYRNLLIKGNSIYSTIEQGSGIYGLGIALTSSTINSDAMVNICDNYIEAKCRGYIMSAGDNGVVIKMSNNIIKSYFSGAANYNSRLGLGDYKIADTMFDGTGNSYVEGTGGNYRFTNCSFNNMINRCFYGDNAASVSISNSTKNNGVAMYTAAGTSPKLIDYILSSTNNKVATGTAAPSTGSWLIGDIVYNTAPAGSGFIGWVCTTSGTPGTWKTFGVISN